MQRQAAPLRGGKGDSWLLLEEVPPLPPQQLLLLRPSLVPWWQSGCLLQGGGRLWLLGYIFCSSSWETSLGHGSGDTQPWHLAALRCPLQSPSLSPLLLAAGAGSSPWKEEALSWSRTCPWWSVASAESRRWVSPLGIARYRGAGLRACCLKALGA